jgi:tetratricopeptide (TPR) repeat protein
MSNFGLGVFMLSVLLSVQTASQRDPGQVVYGKVADSVVLLIVENAAGEQMALGSGFVIDGNLIVTNAHVARAGSVFVKSGVFKALCSLERLDDVNDLAILKPPAGLTVPPLKLSNQSPPNGLKVFAIGNPKGLEKTISEGLLTGLRELEGKSLLQISAAISPGSSGGPVVDSDGAVVGVAVAGFKTGQNLNFAVPAAAVRKLLTASESTTVAGLIASAKTVAAQKQAAKFDYSEGSEWMQLNTRQKELLTTAVSLAQTPAELLQVFDAAAGPHWVIASEAASKALSLSRPPSAAVWAAVARAAQGRSAFLEDKAEQKKWRQEGVSAAAKAVSLSPTPENYYLLADIQEDLGADLGASLNNFTKAFQGDLPPDMHWAALRGMLRTARSIGRDPDALAWFGWLKDSKTIEDYDWLQHADYLVKMNKWSEGATIYYQLARKENQDSYTKTHDLFQKAALNFYVAGDNDAALRSAREGIARASSAEGSERAAATCQLVIAAILNERGVHEQAAAAAKQSIALDPKRFRAYLELARAMNSLERYSEAESAAKTALSLSDGAEGDVHFELGAAYFNQEKWGLAKQAYEMAARLDPKDSIAAYNVAASLYNERFYTEAIPWYEECLRRDPSRKDAAEIRATIARLRRR